MRATEGTEPTRPLHAHGAFGPADLRRSGGRTLAPQVLHCRGAARAGPNWTKLDQAGAKTKLDQSGPKPFLPRGAARKPAGVGGPFLPRGATRKPAGAGGPFPQGRTWAWQIRNRNRTCENHTDLRRTCRGPKVTDRAKEAYSTRRAPRPSPPGIWLFTVFVPAPFARRRRRRAARVVQAPTSLRPRTAGGRPPLVFQAPIRSAASNASIARALRATPRASRAPTIAMRPAKTAQEKGDIMRSSPPALGCDR